MRSTTIPMKDSTTMRTTTRTTTSSSTNSTPKFLDQETSTSSQINLLPALITTSTLLVIVTIAVIVLSYVLFKRIRNKRTRTNVYNTTQDYQSNVGLYTEVSIMNEASQDYHEIIVTNSYENVNS